MPCSRDVLLSGVIVGFAGTFWPGCARGVGSRIPARGEVEGSWLGGELRLLFASHWVISSLKCCGKRLLLLPRYLLLWGWRQEPVVRENGKKFWLEGLSLCPSECGNLAVPILAVHGGTKASPFSG